MQGRPQRVQRELIERYSRISNLYIAYVNSGKFPDEFGREFFHAVGDILQGTSVDQLTLFHVESSSVAPVVDYSTVNGGRVGSKTKKKQPARKKAAASPPNKSKRQGKKKAARRR